MEVAAIHLFPAIGELDVLLQPSLATRRMRLSLSKLSGDETRCPELANKTDMTRNSGSNLTSAMTRLLAARSDAQEPLKAALIYEDALTREWAGDAHAKLEHVVGARNLRSTWWKAGDLSHPGVLAGAVSKAMQAELIVVAVRGSEGLPLPFYFWVNAWLPHHLTGNGLLIGLLGATNPEAPESGRIREYLRNIARQGRFQFFLAERRLKQQLNLEQFRAARLNLSRV